MTDFFSDLERQLTAAANERAQRIRRARARRGAALGGVLLALVAAGAGVAAAVSSTGDDRPHGAPAAPPANTMTTTPDAPRRGRPDGPLVAVLNGTARPGLARGVATRLQKAHFAMGNVTNASDRFHSATLALYAPGHRAQAVNAALALGLSGAAVQPVDSGSRALAGPGAEVVVVVGADQVGRSTVPKTTTAQHR
jgi:hypothetical protein